MAVVIENLHTEEAAPAAPPAAPTTPPREAGVDEQALLTTLALEAWAVRRLIAD